jgi:hypothetical protein
MMANSDRATSPETRRGRKSRIFLKAMLRLYRLYSESSSGPATPGLTADGPSCYNGVAAGAITASDMPRAGKSCEAFFM